MQTIEEVLDKILAILKERGLNEGALADIVGHTPSWFSQIKSGNIKLSAEDLFIFFDFLGITPADFFCNHKIEEKPTTIEDRIRKIFREEIPKLNKGD